MRETGAWLRRDQPLGVFQHHPSLHIHAEVVLWRAVVGTVPRPGCKNCSVIASCAGGAPGKAILTRNHIPILVPGAG
eukprot:7172942-Prymnesium_polylepis.1